MLKTNDPLCPLGFYPQVRWPTRCKRCYREYSEHKQKRPDSSTSGLRKDRTTGSSPSLNTAKDEAASKTETAAAASRSLLAEEAAKNYTTKSAASPLSRRLGAYSGLKASSWSAHDLRTVGTDDDSDTETVKDKDDDFMSVTSHDDDTFASALTAQSQAPPVPPRVTESPAVAVSAPQSSASAAPRKKLSVREVKTDNPSNGVSADVAFIIKLKNAKKPEDDDDMSTMAPSEASVWTDATGGTDTTDTTLVDEKNQQLEKTVSSLQKELDKFKKKVDRLNKEKKELMDKQTAAVKKSKSQSEVLKLQQKMHELTSSNEDLLDDKKSLELEVLELNRELGLRPLPAEVDKTLTDLRMRLSKAESLVEDLQEENEELKGQVKDMEEEMEEIHDNFREDQAEEYHDLKRELEQANKNCRIIQFKLRKAERSNDELIGQKTALEEQLKNLQSSGAGNSEKLENELKVAQEVSKKLGEEVEMLRKKTNSLDVRPPIKRQSSASDENKLLRDLQDTLEREADLKEQMKFAEEEAAQLRKKLVRVEEENESLAIQLKKMAKKGRRPASGGSLDGPSSVSHDRDEGISEDIEELSPQELKIQLELNERETSSLRKKVDNVESENERLQRQVKELQERMSHGSKATIPEISISDPNAYYEQKINVLEEEMNELRKKLIDKERENDSLKTEAEMGRSKKGGKVIYARSRSLDINELQTSDLRRQLQLAEQEAQQLRSKNSELEREAADAAVESRRLSARLAKRPAATGPEKLAMEKAELEERLSRAERRLSEKEATIGELRRAVKEAASGGDQSRLSPSRSPREGRRAERNSEVDVEGLRREKDALQSEMKSKERELSAAKKKVSELSSEKERLSDMVRKMKDIPNLKTRIPKKVTDLTPKNTLKKWVEELEDEIAVCAIQLKNNSNNGQAASSFGKSKDVLALEEKVKELTTSIDDYKKNVTKLEREKEDLEIAKNEAESEKLEAEKAKQKAEKEKTKVEKEKKRLETESSSSSKAIADQTKALRTQVDKVSKELEEEKSQLSSLKQQLDLKERQLQRAKKGEEAKDTTEKELADKVLELTAAETKLRSSDSKLKTAEKQAKELQEKLELTNSQLAEAQERLQQLDTNQRSLSSHWLTEREDLKTSVDRLQARVTELEKTNAEKQKRIKELEESKGKVSSTAGGASIAKIDALQKDKAKLEKQLKEFEEKITQHEKKQHAAEEKARKLEQQYKKEKEEWETQRKSSLSDGTSSKERVEKLEANLADQMQEYEDLTRKYELLEEDYVVIKAQMVMEKEQIEGEFTTLKHEYDTAQRELRTLRETYNAKQDQWIKDKLDMEEKMKEADEKLNRSGGEAWRLEKTRLQDQISDKETEIARLKKAEEFYMDEISSIKREGDEMRRKLDDYNMVSKIQRNLSVDNSHLEKEIRDLKTRIVSEEKAHRQEVSHLKIKHDSGLAIMKDELHSLNQQTSKYKRERDTYKTMLEGAQRTIGDLKRKSRAQDDGGDAVDSADLAETNQRVRELTLQLTSLEDQLSAARLEASKLRTEATTERSSWEIRVHDLQTKINELEEDRIMSSGHARISGIRARMELAWSKERAEHQRLIQDTSKLAEELKNTLHEVERQLENERAESKRKVEQVKRSMEDETVDSKRKAKELNEDLLELRDAHAKLRESHRRVARDKERADREREELLQRVQHLHKVEAEEERKITRLVEQLEEQLAVLHQATERMEKRRSASPAPAKASQVGKVNSLAPSVAKGAKAGGPARPPEPDRAAHEFQAAVKDITAMIDELRLTHSTLMEEKERGRSKGIRQQNYRRSASMGDTLSEEGSETPRRAGRSAYPAPPASLVLSAQRRGASLGRKSLSMGLRGDSQDSIYEHDEGSMESLDPYTYTTLPRKKLERDISIDRVSTGSTQSEIISGVNPIKKKKGLKSLLKGLGRSKSIEDSDTGQTIAGAGLQAMATGMQGSGSDLSDISASIQEKEKKGLKGKFSKLFKTPPPSRSQSIERGPRDSASATAARDAPPAAPARRSKASPSPETRPKNPLNARAPPAPAIQINSQPFTRAPLGVPGSALSASRSSPTGDARTAAPKPSLGPASFSQARAMFQS
ncbi:golgin subfamily A member 4-like isoform X3 [Amphibalanus amphitrite]|uniref:golgin subfamily A member 4-like isoform X3 n=1 Tax=Amphibalanus amphitrite TaxID=1232801 RepID=UPI001C92656B|nr:golgin subfamily A member 4-like isoform X3 [Amphibalanus amphitrite]